MKRPFRPISHTKESRTSTRWGIREDAATRALTPEQVAEVKDAIKRHNQRMANRPAPVSSVSGTALLRRQLEAKTQAAVASIACRLYRTAQSRWAGGETTVKVFRDATPKAYGISRRAWSDNGKWTGTNLELAINVQPGWLTRILPVPGLAEAGKMLTTHAEQVEPGLWKASWVRQGRGYDLNHESGYILQIEGEWFHGATAESVRKLAVRRHEFSRRSKRLALLTVPEIIREYGDVQVQMRDSLRAGNCESGTRSWIARYAPGRESGTVAEVLALDSGSYAVRTCKAAILRAAHVSK